MSDQTLTLEMLSGPLDGVVLTLTEETAWESAGSGLLACPWDTELGTPQARFKPDAEGWMLESLKSPHGTYRVNTEERLTTESVRLAGGDILKASGTWLCILT